MRPLFSVLLYVYYQDNFTSILYGFCSANLLTSFIFFGKNIIQDFIKSLGQKFYWSDYSESWDYGVLTFPLSDEVIRKMKLNLLIW